MAHCCGEKAGKVYIPPGALCPYYITKSQGTIVRIKHGNMCRVLSTLLSNKGSINISKKTQQMQNTISENE